MRTLLKITRSFAAAVVLLHIPLSMAATRSETQTLKQLNDLVNAKRYVEAYQLSNKTVMTMGGEPRFDYLMGMAAMQVKAYDEAVFAFERAVIVKPKWEQARFQLARAYFQTDNLAASKNELTKLKKEAVDPEVVKVLDRFIEQVDNAVMSKLRKFTHVLGMYVGHDSNINSGTTVSEIYIDQIGTTIPLGNDSKETADATVNFSYQGIYQEPLTQNRLIIAQLALFTTDFRENSTFERSMADVSVKMQDVVGDFTYQVGVFFRPMLLDNSHYRDQYGFATNWSLPLNTNWSVGLQAGFGKVDSRIDKDLDVRDIFASLTAKYQTGLWQHVIGANHTDIHAVESRMQHNSYNFFQLDYQTSYILTSAQQLSFNLQYQKFNYDLINLISGTVRDEDFVRAGLGWNYLVGPSTMLQINYRYSDKRSNVPIFAYSRNEIGFGLNIQF